jgi:hypothetical protein
VVTRDSEDKTRYRCDLGFATFTTPKDWNPNRSNRQTYVIIVKDNRLLLIIAGATKKVEVEKAVDDLLATWKWKSTEEK